MYNKLTFASVCIILISTITFTGSANHSERQSVSPATVINQTHKKVLSTPQSIRFRLRQMRRTVGPHIVLIQEADKKLGKLQNYLKKYHDDKIDVQKLKQRVFNQVSRIDDNLARIQEKVKHQNNPSEDQLYCSRRYNDPDRIKHCLYSSQKRPAPAHNRYQSLSPWEAIIAARRDLKDLLIRVRFLVQFADYKKDDTEHKHDNFYKKWKKLKERVDSLDGKSSDAPSDTDTHNGEKHDGDETNEHRSDTNYQYNDEYRVTTQSGQKRYVVCHRPDRSRKQLVLPAAAVQAHLNHGDHFGLCSND